MDAREMKMEIPVTSGGCMVLTRKALVLTKGALAILLCFPLILSAQGNVFTKVRYNGGSVSTKVKPDDWDNKLTVTGDAITLSLKDGQSIAIPPKRVTSLSYGQEAHRRVGTAVGLAVLSLGIGALSALHKTKLHYIGINYNDSDGKMQGVLLQGDKSNFRGILVALQGVTGIPVSVGEKDRNEVPVGVTTRAVKEAEEPKEKPSPATKAPGNEAPATVATEAPATVALTSNPDGAEIYSDGAFVGNSPATLKLVPGKHTIRVAQTGYKDWLREITVQPGSEVHLAATLEKQN